MIISMSPHISRMIGTIRLSSVCFSAGRWSKELFILGIIILNNGFSEGTAHYLGKQKDKGVGSLFLGAVRSKAEYSALR